MAPEWSARAYRQRATNKYLPTVACSFFPPFLSCLLILMVLDLRTNLSPSLRARASYHTIQPDDETTPPSLLCGIWVGQNKQEKGQESLEGPRPPLPQQQERNTKSTLCCSMGGATGGRGEDGRPWDDRQSSPDKGKTRVGVSNVT